MDYNLWKSVLLDWVNSTGFLIQNYENLNDTDIETFFNAFKQQIKSTNIQSPNVVSFVKDYYKDFHLKLDSKDQVPVSEYVYFYSLFLHFACVLHADSDIQQICNSMVRKNQERIEKYLDFLFKIGKCERSIVQSAIEEAENCDLNAQRSPITRNFQSLLSNTSPQTPKSRMLNTWNLENRNLKAQLETERFERGYLEMQLSQCEKKLSKLDDDYKEVLNENNYLKKQIQTLDEDDELMKISETDYVARQFRRQISEKEDELMKLTITYNEAKDDIEILKEKLHYAESQVKLLNTKLLESFSEAESFRTQLDEREKMISYVNNNNKELSDLLKELQSNSKKQDFDSSTSYEMLNSTANDLNTSSFCVMEENLANAVVDIRLIDQQKQNMLLNESVNRLQSELSMIQDEANKLYKIMSAPSENGVEPPSLDTIFSTIQKNYTDISEENGKLSQQIKDRCSEIASLQSEASDYKITIGALSDKLQSEESENENLLSQNKKIMVELESLKTSLNTCEIQKTELNALLVDADSRLEQIQSEKRELIAKHFEEVRHIRSELEEKLENLKANLEATTNERNDIHSKFENVKYELEESMEMVAKHKAEIKQISSELTKEKAAREEIIKKRDAAQAEFNELSKKFAEIQDDLNGLQAKNADISSELAQQNDQIVKLKNDLLQAEATVAGLQSTIAVHIEKENQLVNEIKDAKDSILQKVQTIESLNVEIESLNDRLVKSETEINGLIESQTVLKGELDSLTQEKHQLNVQLTEKTEESCQIQSELQQKIEHQLNEEKRLQSEISTLQTDCEAANARVALLEQEKVNYVSEIGKLTELHSTVKKQCDDLLVDASSRLEQIQTEKNELIEQHTEEVRHIRSELEEKLESLKTNLEATTNERNDIQSKLENAKHELKESMELVAKRNEEIEQISTEITKEKAAREEIIKERDSIQAEFNELSKKFAETQDDLNKMQTNNTEITSKMSQHDYQIEKLTKDLLESEATAAELQTKIAAHVERENQLVNDIKDANDLISQKVQTIESLNVEINSLNERVVKSETEISALIESQTTLKSELDSLTQENHQLNEQCREITSLQAEAIDYKTTISTLNDKLRLEKIENENLLSQNKTIISTSEIQKTELNASLVEANLRLEQLQNELSMIQDEVDSLYKIVSAPIEDGIELPSPHTMISMIKQKYTDISEANVKFSQEINDRCDQIASLQAEANEFRVNIGAFNDKLQLEESENKKIIDELECLKTSMNTCETQKTELNALLIDANLRLEQMQTELSMIKDEANKLYKVMSSENDIEPPSPHSIISMIQQKYAGVSEETVKLSQLVKDQCSEIATLQAEASELKVTIGALNDKLQSEESENKKIMVELDSLKMSLNTHETQKTELNALLVDANSRMEQIQSEKRELIAQHTEEVRQIRTELEGKLENLKTNLEAMTNERNDIHSKFENVKHELKESMELVAKQEASANNEQIMTLNEQLVQSKISHNEAVNAWKKEKEELTKNMSILRAKLMKEREAAEQKESEYKAMRNGFEEKLEKMKEKMKFLYKEEMAKVQEKHEKQLNELTLENRRFTEKVAFLDDRVKDFSSQIYSLNEEKLLLLKEHEIMKSKLRTYEIGSTLNAGTNSSSALKFYDKIRGGNFRMEDEEGELFDNTYLDELQRGSGRESITLDEIQRRNSMVPPHLRSSYMPQFAEPKTNENSKLDSSMFSTQSDSRRGTAYKKPGPPTPSKNGGRFSLGGSDLPKSDVLREQNGERPSLGGMSKASKKSTPGKFTRMFSSSKLKDEDKENGHTSGRNTLQHIQQMFFSTSTPRRRHARRSSSLPKFDTTSFGLANSSVSTIEYKFTTDTKRLASLSRNLFAHTKRISQKFLRSTDNKATDSTPEYDKVHQDSTKVISAKKSFIKKRASLLKKKALRNKTQKEKRFAAYDKRRCIPKLDHVVDETYSFGGESNISGVTCNKSGATYNISTATYDLDDDDDYEEDYESEILDFQTEINEHQGPIEIIVENVDDAKKFEKLCNVKHSECPFEGTEKNANQMIVGTTSSKSLLKPNGNRYPSISPQSISSNFKTRLSSHCARNCWSQHRIPKITTYKAEKKSFDNKSTSSVRSHHTNQSLMTTVRSFHSNVANGWQDLPTFIQYYVASITICLIANMYLQFFR